MSTLKTVLIGLAGLVVCIVVVGFALPGNFKVARSVEIAAPMIRVYPMIYDPKAWARWSVWYRRDPAIKTTYSGPAAGVGAKWAWESTSQGNGSMEMTLAEFDKAIGYKLSLADFASSFDGRFDFERQGNNVKVTWTTEGSVGNNPLMHYFALAMDRMIGPDFEAGLKNLKEIAEKP
jgi:uncharacterized membrane protein